MTAKLIGQDQVFALLGGVGTPRSRAAAPLAARRGVPYIAPYTGAEFLRDPSQTHIINLRASYFQETEEMVERLTGELGIKRVGVFHQNDSYGAAGLEGVQLALQKRGLDVVSTGYYTRNTRAVKTAAFDLSQGAPEAIIMVGAYAPTAEIVDFLHESHDPPVLVSISFVGGNTLPEELHRMGSDSDGVLVTQVVPFPYDTSVPVVASYQRALAATFPDAVPCFVSLERYLAGRLAIAGLERCGAEVSRECFLAAFNGTFDIDGFQLDFSNDNQGSDQVYWTVIEDGEYQTVSDFSSVLHLHDRDQ